MFKFFLMVKDMIYDSLECNSCGVDLKFTAPFRKNGNWFCSSICSVSASIDELHSKFNGQKTISSNKGKISESDNLEEFNFIYEEILKDSSETINFICNE